MELLQSSRFTESSAEDKDLTQKLYFNINEWIDFLVNPSSWIKQKRLLTTLISKAESLRERKDEDGTRRKTNS